MSTSIIRDSAAVICVSALLVGCGGLSGGVVEDIPQAAPERGGGVTASDGTLFGDGGLRNLFKRDKGDEGGANLPVNKYLWRASIDTLSQILPIATVDTFSGVISTDWGPLPQVPNERVRATAFVTSRELSAQSLSVTVYREVLGPTGAWQTAPVDPATAERLEDSILTRARQLRIEDVDGG